MWSIAYPNPKMNHTPVFHFPLKFWLPFYPTPIYLFTCTYIFSTTCSSFQNLYLNSISSSLLGLRSLKFLFHYFFNANINLWRMGWPFFTTTTSTATTFSSQLKPPSIQCDGRQQTPRWANSTTFSWQLLASHSRRRSRPGPRTTRREEVWTAGTSSGADSTRL